MTAIAIIPARYASTRFPGKPLADLFGKPIIRHVYERASQGDLFRVVCVASDDERIAQSVLSFSGKCCLTSSDHASGTDRVAEATLVLERELGLQADVIVNIQGDEPLISSDVLKPLLDTFLDPNVKMASLMTLITDSVDPVDPNIVKVVVDQHRNALYFSRSLIPFDRDRTADIPRYRHIGVYAYRRETLLRFVRLPVSSLEQSEKLEQLRALENGIPIRMVLTDYQGIGIDTPEDLAHVQAKFRDTLMRQS
ncbi:MAG TPA: 3-deoxy-manno-octulosonate cytidylyltransferase [Candidatus Cloacimonadota bacterium]|nr:3-deoxy-manno-octulosonate cytidylyltransferase [Candidatus Cloacimonadota bacterium]